jgi:nitroimidazol reductase NimA-like FMN-containing flavoprotein (pyridoxamine 5'-phosphate oxidase superfamily)
MIIIIPVFSTIYSRRNFLFLRNQNKVESMRRKEDEITQHEEIINILEKATICRLALHGDEFPYIIPLNFGYQDEEGLNLYFHCARKGKKLQLIRQNNKACFEAEADTVLVAGNKPCGWSMKFRSVIGYGSIKIIEDELGIRQGLNVLMRHYTGDGKFEYDESVLKETYILQLKVHKISAKSHGFKKM